MKLKNLKTNFLGRNVIYYKKIDSTQKEIYRRIDKNNIKNGTVIFADIQTDAIGTHGRKWHTDEKNNIAFSIYVELNCNINKLEGLTIEIAKIIITILKHNYGVELQVKEPNDIYYNNKKIGGILTETKTNKEKVKYLIVGIGINTNKNTFPEDISLIATSILKEFRVEVNTQDFISEFCNLFEIEIEKRLS